MISLIVTFLFRKYVRTRHSHILITGYETSKRKSNMDKLIWIVGGQGRNFRVLEALTFAHLAPIRLTYYAFLWIIFS